MKHVKLTISVIILIIIMFLGQKLIRLSIENQNYKKDYAEINHFKYGLFSVDIWRLKISQIVSEEIDTMSLTKENKDVIQKQLEKQLVVLIDGMYKKIEESKSAIELTVMDSFVDINEIKKGVPGYAREILKEMSKQKNESQIKGLLKEKINTYLSKTFDLKDESPKHMIMQKYQVKDEIEANKLLATGMNDNFHTISLSAIWIVILAVILFVMEGMTKGPFKPAHYFILTLTLIVLMVIGVTTPMIDMEAKIDSFAFMLFDRPVEFKNQILYFQSKSILDVFTIMITHKDLQMKLVGVLVVSFSVIFPLAKMLSSLAYYYNYCEARRRWIVKFFVEKSGKWSMADVLVVAIFMAYIGFNGIINSQLKNIGESAQSVDLITTNGTNLQPGFYVFMCYTILAMFLSAFIAKRPCPGTPAA